MKKPGFIQHHWSNQRYDSIRADSVIQRIENEAMRSCGLYYEIYHHHVISQLCQQLKILNAADRLSLITEAAKRGFKLDKSSEESSRQSYQETLTEIRRGEY